MLLRKLAAVFAAVALSVPAGQALADPGIQDHNSRYGGALVVQPPHSARVDTTLTIKPSETSFSRRIEALQQRFGNMMPDVKLVAVDKDWFQQNAILNGTRAHQYAPNDDEKSTIRRLASEYVRARTQISFNPVVFEGLERDVLRTEGMAIKFQYGATREEAKSSEKNICLLFPHYADKSRDQYYGDLINRNASINGPLANTPLREPADIEYMKRFVDYHEIGHCYDRWYIKNVSMENGPQAFLESRHKAEVFGEVFANLMLARDGYQNFSQKQADLRLAIAAFGGPLSARVNDPGDVKFYMTYAYLLHEGSRNAGREIERLGTVALQALSMDEILDLAHDITERSTFDAGYVPVAVAYMMANRYDLSGWESQRAASPQAEQIYQTMIKLRYEMEQAVRRVFDFGDRVEPVLRPASFDFSNPSFPRAGASALEARARELGRELRQGLGWSPSANNLARAFQQKKDALRRVLETGSAQAQDDASRDLGLMHMALKYAYDALPQPQQRMNFSVKWDAKLFRPAA